MLGEVHVPLAHRTFPDTGVQLAARAVVVVEHHLFRIALEDFRRVWPVAFCLGGGLAEVDDVLDAHCCNPP
ncbi:hypothetical protein D3C73_1261440 [compost metagenome]